MAIQTVLPAKMATFKMAQLAIQLALLNILKTPQHIPVLPAIALVKLAAKAHLQINV